MCNFGIFIFFGLSRLAFFLFWVCLASKSSVLVLLWLVGYDSGWCCFIIITISGSIHKSGDQMYLTLGFNGNICKNSQLLFLSLWAFFFSGNYNIY